MKKITPILFVAAMVFSACEREPRADFFASSDMVEVGEVIHFTNTSMDADYFEWGFGDGTWSNTFHADHAYTASGIYRVSLAAWHGEDRVDHASMRIEVLFPTSMEITVLEYYDEYPVEDASILFYGSLEDWIDEVDPIVEAFTDRDGRAVFSGLFPKRYYLDVWEYKHNNYILAEEDVAFIETPRLTPNEMNYFIAWVDYVSGTKKNTGRRDREVRISRIEKTGKREYKEKIEKYRSLVEKRMLEREKNE